MALILACLFFLLPVQFALSPATGIDLPIARVVSVGCILAWVGGSLLRRRMQIPWSSSSGFLLSFLFLMGISVGVASEPSWAFRKAIFLLSFFPLFFVCREVVSKQIGTSEWLAQWFVRGAILSAGVGVVQVLLQVFLPVERLFAWWTGTLLPFFLGEGFARAVAEYPSLLVNLSGVTVMRASAFFPDPHMHAFYLGLALPFAIFFAWKTKSMWWWSGVGLLCLADLLTFSRGAYLGIGLTLVGILLLWRRAFLKNMSIGVMIGVSGILLGLWVPNPITERFKSGFSLADGSVSARVSLYQEAFAHIGEHPWFGVGLGNYPLAVKPTALPREPIYVHNLWLDIAVEMGLIGMMFFAGFFFSITRSVFVAGKKTGNSFYLAIFGALLIFFGHSLVETPLFSVQVLPALLLVLALGTFRYDQHV